jgi:homeobox protein cut-like
LYSALSEAPDPFPLLEASVESLVISEDTVPKLTEEKETLRRRLDSITSQLEDAEIRLKEERTLRSRLEQDQDGRNKELEVSWTKVLQEKQANWEAKEKALEEKVEDQDRLLREIKANYEVSQRLGQNAEPDSSWQGGAAATELEMVHADLEKTASRLADIEARNEQLRIELAQAVSQSPSGRPLVVQDDPAFLTLQSENSALRRRLDAARLDNNAEKQEWQNKLQQIARQKQQLSSEAEDLKAKVEKWADYDDMRRELDMIKAIEFSTGDDSEANASTIIANGTAHSGGGKESLEQLLMTRNKKLSSEMTILRVSHQALQKQLEDLQEQLSRTSADLEKSQHLTVSLENDLLKVQEESSNELPSSAMSMAGTLRHPQSTRRGRASPTSSIISGFDTGSRTPSSTLEALRAGEPVGGGSGILPMIQAQRDRFKQKNSQLEDELSKTYATVTSLRQEVASLQKDNLSLYEKTRYVSTYSRGAPATVSSSSAYAQGPGHTAIQISPDASSRSLDRYKPQYEANISPFAAFRGRESARAYKRMSLPERVIYSITRMILATRTSRNLFAGYCLALHVLIFLMLYWTGTGDIDKHAGGLGDSAAAVAVAAAAGRANLDKDKSLKGWQPDDQFHGG